jgi:predicted phage replisome organizer
MAEVKWIKLMTDIWNNRKIKQIKKMPEGKSIVIIWLQILCLAGDINDRGLIYLAKDIPYTDEMLATEFGEELTTIRLALQVLQHFNMIQLVDNILLISNWEKYQNADGLEKIKEQNRIRQSRYKEKQKLLVDNVSNNVTVTQQVTLGNAIDIDRERDIDKEKIKEDKYDKYDKALENSSEYINFHPFTTEIIKKGYIDTIDLDIPSYNKLFKSLQEKYDNAKILKVLRYVLEQIKTSDIEIDNKFAYLKKSIEFNLEKKERNDTDLW